MEEWKECKLGDVLAEKGYIRGPFGSTLKRGDMKESGIPVYEQQHAIYQSRDFRFFIDEKKFSEMKRFKVETDDLLISCSGTVGKVTIISEDDPKGIISQALLILRCNTNIILPQYLKYFFLSSKGYNSIISRSSGSVQVNLAKRDVIESIPLSLPPLATQQKIAAILSSLDDKIELNNKINANLEQQAGVLFKNWFVDLEPFGGKMPDGWKEADIYSIANIIYGSPFASKLFNTEKNGKPIIRIRDLKDQHSDVYTPEERDDAYLIQPKDIVVGMDGEFRPYIWGSEPGWLNQRVCVFENKRPKGKAFLYFSIKPLLDVVEKTQVATTVIHIGKKDFDKFQITLPTEEILDKFDELTEPILDQIVANRLENRRLAELRDALLPKLMNGEIEV